MSETEGMSEKDDGVQLYINSREDTLTESSEDDHNATQKYHQKRRRRRHGTRNKKAVIAKEDTISDTADKYEEDNRKKKKATTKRGAFVKKRKHAPLSDLDRSSNSEDEGDSDKSSVSSHSESSDDEADRRKKINKRVFTKPIKKYKNERDASPELRKKRSRREHSHTEKNQGYVINDNNKLMDKGREDLPKINSSNLKNDTYQSMDSVHGSPRPASELSVKERDNIPDDIFLPFDETEDLRLKKNILTGLDDNYKLISKILREIHYLQRDVESCNRKLKNLNNSNWKNGRRNFHHRNQTGQGYPFNTQVPSSSYRYNVDHGPNFNDTMHNYNA